MKNDKLRYEKLERVIKDVYGRTGNSPVPSLDTQWKTNVLQQIRSLQNDIKGQLTLMGLFQQTVWRLAPAAAGLAFMMALWIYKGGLSPDIDIAALAMNNPDQFSMFQMFGM